MTSVARVRAVLPCPTCAMPCHTKQAPAGAHCTSLEGAAIGFATVQDDHDNPADTEGLPILCEHFAFVALHAMLPSLPSMPRFCDRLWASQERLAPDATLHAAVVAVHAAAGGEAATEDETPSAPVAALPVLPAAAAEPLPSTEVVVCHLCSLCYLLRSVVFCHRRLIATLRKYRRQSSFVCVCLWFSQAFPAAPCCDCDAVVAAMHVFVACKRCFSSPLQRTTCAAKQVCVQACSRQRNAQSLKQRWRTACKRCSTT